jgi:uncharacterized RDD family membrane protein YckC
MSVMQRPTIEDIPEMKYRTRHIRDSDGVLQKVQQEFYGVREVKVVSGWARFGHYLLDLVFLFILRILLEFGVGILIGSGVIEYPGQALVWWLIGLRILMNIMYYAIFEATTGGTPAKLILGRTVIDEYGQRPDAGKLLLRSLSRMVPFEAFSCLGERGWHDTWTKTYVVRKEEAEELRRLLLDFELKKTTRDAHEYMKASAGPQVLR